MSASGPVQDAKLNPAAAMEDQGKEPSSIVLGGAPFSSPDPLTDAKKMLPLEDGTSAYEARESAAEAKASDYDSMKKPELQAAAAERDLDVTGMKVDEIRAALRADDSSDMKAADFKAQVEAAEDQEALDAAAQLYADSGKEYSSVEDAIEKKQDEIDEAEHAGDGGGANQ